MAPKGGLVEKVEPGSPAAGAGIVPGERLWRINGQEIHDLLDYYFAAAEPDLVLELTGPQGVRRVAVSKEWDQDLGLIFSPDSFGRMQRCRNRCLFCFVDQLPRGLRPTLYVKDDDYRYSVLYGNYITLTNLKEKDWQRILALRPSPLYVSVHTVDPQRRAYLLGTPRARAIREELARLAAAGIELHGQVVLCRQLNDGAYLEETVHYLASLWPGFRSVAVVPVGLTRHRQHLYPLLPFDQEGARRVLNQVARLQHHCLARLGSRLVFAADEFYLLAGRPFPAAEAYEGFPQLENGVGLTRLFLDEWAREIRSLGRCLRPSRPVALVTGRAAGKILLELVRQLRRLWPEARVEVFSLENRFFGPSITVAGLLTGQDIKRGLQPHLSRLRREKALILLPQSMLRDGYLFLDNYTLRRLAAELSLEVESVAPTAGALLRKLEVVLWQNPW